MPLGRVEAVSSMQGLMTGKLVPQLAATASKQGIGAGSKCMLKEWRACCRCRRVDRCRSGAGRLENYRKTLFREFGLENYRKLLKLLGPCTLARRLTLDEGLQLGTREQLSNVGLGLRLAGKQSQQQEACDSCHARHLYCLQL